MIRSRPAAVWSTTRIVLSLILVSCLGYLGYTAIATSTGDTTPASPGSGFIDLARGPRTHAVMDGLTIYVNPEDRYLTAAALRFGYEPVLTKVFLENVHEGDTVIDIGANIGYYSMLAAKKVGPRGRVIAFEPDPQAFSILKRNMEVNGFTNIVAEQKAVSNARGTLKLYIAPQNLGDHRIFPSEESRQEIAVQAVALDQYLPAAGAVHFIKVDTQGAESVIFEGMQRTLRRHKNVRLAAEFWPYGLELAGSSGSRLLNQIHALGFRMQDVDEFAKTVRDVSAPELLKRYAVETKANTNLLLTRAE